MILPNALPALAITSGKAAEPCAGSAAGGGLVDLHGERLAGVSGSDEDRVAAAGGRDAGDCGCTVAVGGEGDPGRQGPGLGQRRGGESAGGDGEGSRIAPRWTPSCASPTIDGGSTTSLSDPGTPTRTSTAISTLPSSHLISP
jgi:hypothetical protein